MGWSEEFDKTEIKLKKQSSGENAKRMDIIKETPLMDIVSEGGIEEIRVNPDPDGGVCYVKFKNGEQFGFQCFDVTFKKEEK